MNGKMNSTEKEPGWVYERILDAARSDPNIIGVFLGGSRGKGLFTKHSDYDVCLVVVDEKAIEYKRMYPRHKHYGMELGVLSLSQMRVEADWGSTGQWGRYDFAWITAVIDKTGEIQRLIDEKGKIPASKVKEFIEENLDTYINQFYRSLKCFRDGYILGARLEVNVEIECLLNLLFALHDRRLKPFYKYLAWELEAHPLEKVPYTPHEFMGKLSRIASDADIETQREIFLMVEKLCRAEGYGYYIDDWDNEDGKPTFVFMRTFRLDKKVPSSNIAKGMVPLLEIDPSPDALIEPRFAAKKIDIAEHCIICFFKDVIEDLIKVPGTRVVAREHSVMGDFPVYETTLNGKKVVFFHPGLGAPLCTSILEFVIQLGCKKFIAIGSAGAVRDDIPPGNIIVPVAAVRDEGTSYHYLAPSREVSANPVVLRAIENELNRQHVSYITAKTWTTDAYYRETLKKIEIRRAEGCATVEMEAAAFFAVAKFRNVLLGQILYCDDDVSDRTWKLHDVVDPRSLQRKMFDLAVDICSKL